MTTSSTKQRNILDELDKEVRCILDENHDLVWVNWLAWAEWMQVGERRVAHTSINRRKKSFVSTVFLGIDHGWREPQWFETMVFGTSINEKTIRYRTWKEAELGHALAVRSARQARQCKYRPYKFKHLGKRRRHRR